MPLPGERLRAPQRRRAFEEQRQTGRRAGGGREDSAASAPFMILNGRRIEQRSNHAAGGLFHQHLRPNGFDPMEIDGTDPAAFGSPFTLEEGCRPARLELAGHQFSAPGSVLLHYTIAGSAKPGRSAGAWNSPPRTTCRWREPLVDSASAVQRVRSRLRAVARTRRSGRTTAPARSAARPSGTMPWRTPAGPRTSGLQWKQQAGEVSPMAALDGAFAASSAQPHSASPRVGNPNELRRQLQKARH